MRTTSIVGMALLVAGLLVDSSASAGIRRMHAAACQSPGGATTRVNENGAFSSSGSLSFLCGVDSEPGILNHTNVTTVNVHGFDASTSGNAFANLCITNFDADSFSCGSTEAGSFSGTGNYTLTLSTSSELSAWTDAFNTGDFPYIRAGVNNTNVRIRGFFIETTD